MVGCNHCETDAPKTQSARNVLWIALLANAIMFAIELGASFMSDSVSLRADALDFLGDAANYGVSLFVLGMSLHTRAKASFLKGLTMGTFGLWVLASAIYHFYKGTLPHAETMGIVGFVALAVNATVAFMLYKFRNKDSNMQSVWMCSRNDAIGNIAVMAAAGGVFMWSTNIPDLLVALLIAGLSLNSSYAVIKLARIELKTI